MQIRPISNPDIPAITEIYNYYIQHSSATFEELCIDAAIMSKRVGAVVINQPWLVAVQDNVVMGYAYATPWKLRSAYRNTVESTVYVHPEHFKKGIGVALYKQLLEKLKEMKTHAVLGGITLPNAPSVGLHEKLGFVKVAHFKETGFKFGVWQDVGYWQLLLD